MDMKDEQLKDLFNKSLLQAPENPWFVKKVMNRLPDEKLGRGESVSWIEYISYIVAIAALGVFAAYKIHEMSVAEFVTVEDFISLLVIGVVLCVVSIMFFLPMIRQWVNEE